MASKAGQNLYVASGSEDGTVFLWCVSLTPGTDRGPNTEVTCEANYIDDAVVGEPQRAHIAGVTSICVPPKHLEKDIILTAAKDQVTKAWRTSGSLEYSSPGHAHAADGHTDFVNHVAWSPAGDNFATCSDDGTAKLWNGDTGNHIVSMGKSGGAAQGHSGPVPMVDWAPDGSRLLTCSYDSTCAVWEIRSQQARQWTKLPRAETSVSEKHSQAIWSARFSPDASNVLTASKDGTACIWNPSEGQVVNFLKGHTDSVLQGVWDPHDPKLVLTCAMDNTARIWDIRTKDSILEIKEHSGVVWQATFGRDSVLTAAHDMTAAVFDKRGGKTRQILTGHTGILWQATYSPNEQWVLTCSEDSTARLWHVASGKTKPKYIVLQDETNFHVDACNCAVFAEAPIRAPKAKEAAIKASQGDQSEKEEDDDVEEV